MQLIISGRGVVLTTAFKALVERKAARLTRVGPPTLELRVTCGSERFQRTARLVARTPGEGAIDTLRRQMREARTRRRRTRSRRPAADATSPGA